MSLEKEDFEMAKIRFLTVYKTIIFQSNKLTQEQEDDESFPDVLSLEAVGKRMSGAGSKLSNQR